jgi:hypothetical protein
MSKYTYKQHKEALQEINNRKENLFNYYKDLVQRINNLYQSNVICLSELTEMLTRESNEQREAIAQLNNEIDNLPSYN